MYHFFVSEDWVDRDTVTVSGSDVNHMKNVLRMRSGEKVSVSAGQAEYLCELLGFGPDGASLRILSAGESGAELPARIYLFQGLPKKDKMDLIIQKAVELGVYRIIPVETKRTVVKLDGKKEEERVRRWNAVAESAAKQSGRGMVPEVERVRRLEEAFDYAGSLDINVIPYERAEGMERTKRKIAGITAGMSAGIFIGPEGGFEEAEIELARSRGIEPVTLGRRILRTETAGLALLSVLMFQLES